MPKMNFQTIEANPVNGKPLGTRRDQSLKGIFASSPLYAQAESAVPNQGSVKLTPEGLKQWYLDNVVNGTVVGSDGYYGFSENYSLDFTGVGASNASQGGGPPDFKNVKTGGGGLPATAFVPNPASPGEGNGTNASAIPEAKDFATQISAKVPSTPGSGPSANEDARNPISTSKAMKTASLVQTLGKSPASVQKSNG